MISWEILYYSFAVATVPRVFIWLLFVVITVVEGIKDALD